MRQKCRALIATPDSETAKLEMTLVVLLARIRHLIADPTSRGLIIDQLQHKISAVAREIAASVTAVAAYILAALCVGWLVSILLGPMGYAWPRFAIEAAISTCLGMIASLLLKNALFPRRSGKVIFAAFAAVVLLVLLLGRTSAVNWLHLAQALFLVGLAYGLFWPHRIRAG